MPRRPYFLFLLRYIFGETITKTDYSLSTLASLFSKLFFQSSILESDPNYDNS